MKMDRETLYDAITEVRDALVAEAAPETDAAPGAAFAEAGAAAPDAPAAPVPAALAPNGNSPAKLSPRFGKHSGKRWRKPAALAASLALTVGLGAALFSRLGGSAPGIPGAGQGGAGHPDGSSIFMSYAGPVFPMTAAAGGEGLVAARALTYDFSPWNKRWHSNEEEAASRTWLTEAERQEVLRQYNEWFPEGGYPLSSTDLLVTDAYTLENPSAEDAAVTLLYPFAGSLRYLHQQLPALTADGKPLKAELFAGGYTGGFQGAWGSEGESEELLNLHQLDSWQGYAALLAGGGYRQAALEGWPDLSGTPAVVYELTGSYGPAPDDAAGMPNPSLQVGYSLDESKTTVLSYGFNGYWGDEEGRAMQGFSIPQPGSVWAGRPAYLIVVGEDITGLELGGYANGGPGPDTPALAPDAAGAEVRRYETDLEAALRTAAGWMYEDMRAGEPEGSPDLRPDFELYFGALKDYLLRYGALAEAGPERYGTGWLEELDFEAVGRVFYLKTTVTVPAGGSLTVAASFTKEASFDFACAGTENQDIYGYDLLPWLDTTLQFAAQTAEAVNTQSVEIVRQNYGFDWDAGVTRVPLNETVEHYYLEVRRKTEE